MTHGWFKKALCNICITLNEHKTCLLALENCPSLVPEPCGKRSSETPSFLFAILLCEPVLHDICSVTDCHHKSFLRNGVSVFMRYWPFVVCSSRGYGEKKSFDLSHWREGFFHTHLGRCDRPWWPQKLSTFTMPAHIVAHIFHRLPVSCCWYEWTPFA